MESRLAASFDRIANREREHPGKGAPGHPGGGSPRLSEAHSAVLGRLAFRPGPSCWAEWLGDSNLGPWYPQCPHFLDWGSDSPPGGKSICKETIDFKYRWVVNGRLFQHVFFWVNSLFSGGIFNASFST